MTLPFQQEAPGHRAPFPTAVPPGPAVFASPTLRYATAAFVALGLAAAIHLVGRHAEPATQLQLSLILGVAFGFVLQRSRFCFFCLWKDWLDRRDANGALGVLAALAVGVAGYTLIYGAWLPDPSGMRLPPTAHIGPVGPALALAGLVFGAGMAISGSCISAHLYRLGEGSPTAPFALAGAVGGFILGFLSWNSLYLRWIVEAPILWLPRSLGYGGALVASLTILGGLGGWVVRARRSAVWQVPAPDGPFETVFLRRWPGWVGGIFVGMIGVAAYLRLSPLGVTAEIGSRSRQLAAGFDWLPERLEGLDSFRGCATLIRDALLTPNGLFIAGIVASAFVAALLAGEFKPRRPDAGHVARGLIGGVLLGWGAVIGLGCTVGTLLSGISAGAVSGWVFGIAVLVGVTVTLKLGRALRLLG